MKKGVWAVGILVIGLILSVTNIYALSFIRGDANSDLKINIADSIFILDYLFSKGSLPTCLDAGDANDDGVLNVADGIFILQYLFSKGAKPNEPFSQVGFDASFDGLSCGSFAGIISCRENDLACCKESSVNVIKRQNDKMFCYKVDNSLVKPFEKKMIYTEDEFGKFLVGYDIALKNGDLLMHYTVPGYEKIKESYAEIEAKLNSAKTEQEKFSAVLLLFSKVSEENDINIKKEKYEYYLKDLISKKIIGTYEYSEDEDSYNWKIIGFLGLSGINIEEEKTLAYIEFKNLIMESLDKKIEAGEITRYEVKESNLRYIFELYVGDAKQELVIISKIGWKSGMLMDLYDMEEEIKETLEGLDTKENEVLFLTESGESFMDKSEANEKVEEFGFDFSGNPEQYASYSNCIDSDGNNANTYGEVNYNAITKEGVVHKVNKWDVCKDGKNLYEQVCENANAPKEVVVGCNVNCEDGVCVRSSGSCQEEEVNCASIEECRFMEWIGTSPIAGINPFSKGIIKDNGMVIDEEKCFDNLLEEKYCKDGKSKFALIKCPFGCINGACINPSCVDSDGSDRGEMKGFTFWSNPNNPNDQATLNDKCYNEINSEKICKRYEFVYDASNILHYLFPKKEIKIDCLKEFSPPRFCNDGKCNAFPGNCVDKDIDANHPSGLNYEVASSAIDVNGNSVIDKCQDGDYYTLTEGYCGGSNVNAMQFDCRNLGSDYVCASGKCEKNPYGNIEGQTSSWEFKVSSTKRVLFFVDSEFNTFENPFNRKSKEILEKEGYVIKKFMFDINDHTFIDFYNAWESEDGEIVVWDTHGDVGQTFIGKFSNSLSLTDFINKLINAGFNLGDDFDYGIGEDGKILVFLKNNGLKKFKKTKDLVIYRPCHGSTTKDSVNGNVVYYTRGVNWVIEQNNAIKIMIETMAGTEGVKKISSTNAFELVKEKGYFKISDGLSLYDHTNPKDRDIILNPVRWHMLNWIDRSEGGAAFNGEDYVEVTFASPMTSTTSETTEGLVSIESNECPDAEIRNIKWGNSKGEDADTMLSFSIYWDPYCTGTSGCTCNNYGDYVGKIILNSNKLISKENSYFHLNGKKCSDTNLCLKTAESNKEGGRGCVPLGNSGRAVNSCASAIDDFDYFWVRMNEEQNDYNVYEYYPVFMG